MNSVGMKKVRIFRIVLVRSFIGIVSMNNISSELHWDEQCFMWNNGGMNYEFMWIVPGV